MQLNLDHRVRFLYVFLVVSFFSQHGICVENWVKVRRPAWQVDSVHEYDHTWGWTLPNNLMSPDGKIIAFLKGDHLNFYQVLNSKLFSSIKVGCSLPSGIPNLSISPDNKLVAVNCGGNVAVQQVSDGNTITNINLRPNALILNLRFSPDSKKLALVLKDGDAKDSWKAFATSVWEVSSGKLKWGELPNKFGQPDTGDFTPPLEFSPDGSMILSLIDPVILTIRDAGTGDLNYSLRCDSTNSNWRPLRQRTKAATFSLDGKTIVVGSENGETCFFESKTGNLSKSRSSYLDIERVAISPSGDSYLFGGEFYYDHEKHITICETSIPNCYKFSEGSGEIFFSKNDQIFLRKGSSVFVLSPFYETIAQGLTDLKNPMAEACKWAQSNKLVGQYYAKANWLVMETSFDCNRAYSFQFKISNREA
ncbi:MAG: WD40 repeat domain-containing protein, partial [Bdellovibrio sp.]